MKVLARIINVKDGTSFYRGHGPLSELHKVDKSISIQFVDMLDFTSAKGFDLLFYQRPYHDMHIEQIELCKEMHIPVIVDYDDSYLDIPTNNDMHVICKQVGIDYVANIKKALDLADKVIVSTEVLKNKLGVESKTEVIPNAFDDYLFNPSYNFNFNKKILWRGCSGHSVDFVVYEESICKLIEKNRDYMFYFVGVHPKFVEKYRNVVLCPLLPLELYFKKIRSIEPSITIVPLAENSLNLGKSNIAKIEATSIGSLAIAPSWEEWIWDKSEELHDPEHIYNSKEAFIPTVQDAIDLVNKVDPIIEKEFHFCREHMLYNYRLSKVNKLRAEIFREVIENSRQISI